MPFTRKIGGWTDVWGGHIAGLPLYQGPTAYTRGTGDAAGSAALIGAGRRVLFMAASLTVSGNYAVEFSPATQGPSVNWTGRWYYNQNTQGVTSAVIATAGTGQTNGTSTVNGVGGGGSGAQISVTIAGGAVTAVSVLHPGTGYTSAPTFTVAQGGTPGTITAAIGSLFGQEVGTGTNLSAEFANVLAVGL